MKLFVSKYAHAFRLARSCGSVKYGAEGQWDVPETVVVGKKGDENRKAGQGCWEWPLKHVTSSHQPMHNNILSIVT